MIVSPKRNEGTKINDTLDRSDIGDFTTYFVVCLFSLLISSIVVDSIFNCVLTLFFLWSATIERDGFTAISLPVFDCD